MSSPGQDAGEEQHPDDVIRILIATDVHLGYAEKNPVRGQDSFTTFEEILQIAREKKVDALLLGGDLFHENKPSRDAELRCVNLLRQHVLGDEPVSIELISDPEVNFGGSQSRKEVNYLDPNMNIALPVFSIHGNHDDPSGLGSHSIMDTLHSNGLLNYFGRIDNLEEISVSPLLIRKGATRLALYGMSSVKDERMHRLFRANKVNMLRPTEETDDWFNLLVLHQNRAKHGETNYLPEHFLDSFLDLVFWGHEHECRLDPERPQCDKQFFITQPGSSVATSLSEGEAKQKKIGLLTIHKRKFKIEEIPLQTVRPMLFRNVVLEDTKLKLKGTDKQVQKEIDLYLKKFVDDLLLNDLDQLLTGHESQPKLPLIRVRVFYREDSHTLLPGKFGNYFDKQVANASEILLFKRATREKKEKDNFDRQAMEDAATEMAGESMEDLIARYFATVEDKKDQLKMLSVPSIAAAVNHFIEKGNKEAIATVVEKQLDKTAAALRTRDLGEGDDDGIDEALHDFRTEILQKRVNEGEEARQELTGQSGVGGGVGSSRIRNGGDQVVDSESPPPSPRGRGSRAGGTRGRPAGRARGGRGRAKTPVVATAAAAGQSGSIADAFARQSQQSQQSSSSTSSRRGRKPAPVQYQDDDSDSM